ncbi:MAG: hypothetical protein IJ525_02215 [Alphaproteobacteria bacterium]|nr:hypothetical protein [Alphaproteobacteria bacterium]
MKKLKNQNGRSMIEMLGVLAIIGVLSVGGIAGYSKAMMKYRINKTIEQITLIAGNVRTFFANQGNYKGLSTGIGCSSDSPIIIKKAKLVPDEMWIKSHYGFENILQGAFGEGVTLKAVDKNYKDDKKGFYIQFGYTQNTAGNIPDEACIEIVSQDWSNIGAQLIYIDNSNTHEIRYLSTPVDINDAISACSGRFFEDTIRFYFDIDPSNNIYKGSGI